MMDNRKEEESRSTLNQYTTWLIAKWLGHRVEIITVIITVKIITVSCEKARTSSQGHFPELDRC